MKDIPVEAVWFRSAYCIGCTSYNVVSGTSGSDGSFAFSAKIDSSFFKDYHLTVRIPRDSGYIILPVDGGVHFAEYSLYDFDANAFEQLKFEYYPKTTLKIKLHRTGNDAFDFFSTNHFFVNDFGYGDLVVTGQQFAKDTVLNVETAADVYTKITWKKMVAGAAVFEETDSLICTKNGDNSFDINY